MAGDHLTSADHLDRCRGGAGKTTLAERLRRVEPNSAIAHTDDVAWNHAYFDWGAVLAENVLRPLHRGEPVDFRPDAWTSHDRPGSIIVRAGLDFVWVEGTGIIREELRRWLDAELVVSHRSALDPLPRIGPAPVSGR